MRLRCLLLGVSFMLLLSFTSRMEGTPATSNLRSETVQTPHGALIIREQRFAKTGGGYPWDLRLAEQVNEEFFSRVESNPRDEAGNVKSILRRFGYVLTPRGAGEGQGYDLQQNGRVLLTEVMPTRPTVVLNEFGDDFALVLLTRGEPALLRRQGLVKGNWALEIPPVFVGKDLVALQVQYPTGHILPGRPIPWSVVRENRAVFTLQVPEDGANPKVKRLAAWGSSWVLEVDGEIYINGSALAPAIGARRVFAWQLMNGRPFYFVETEEGVIPSYGGTLQRQGYDEVIHYACCEPSFYNPASTPESISFWGRRGADWYFVLISTT